ncbi:MAG: tetratricopeptide repeat protein [Kiritimatiellaeota bacterium]|nr:tetratricopeptide repeat protein [Kiritimatiellota bacterium]
MKHRPRNRLILLLAFAPIFWRLCGQNAPAPAAAAETAAPEAPDNRTSAPAAAAVEGPPPVVPKVYETREKGLHALSDGIYEAAIRFFAQYREATEHHEPDFADATALLVQACLRAGLPERAAEALAFHRQNTPGVKDPYYRDDLTYWQGRVELESGRTEAAVKIAQPLVAPSRTPVFRELAFELLGEAFARLENWSEAEKALRRLLADFPKSENAPRVRLALAKVLTAAGKTDEATRVLDAYEQAYPDASKTPVVLCRVLAALKKGDPTTALRYYRSIEKNRPATADPDWWLATSQLADALMANRQWADALEILPHALLLGSTDRDHRQTRLRIADCLIALNKVEQAIAALETFRKDYPGAPEVLPVQFRLAELLRKSKSFVTAGEYFAEVMRSEKAPASLRYRAAISRGWCLSDAGQDEEAMRAFAAAADLGQTDAEKAEALLLAGSAAFRVGNYTSAALYCRTVADQYPKTRFAEQARYKQALARSQAKLFADAATIYKQFLQEHPDSKLAPKARVERGIALKNAGDFAQAVTELTAFAQEFPKDPLAPRALIEAAQAARNDRNMDRALKLYSQLLENYPDSEFFPMALYQRANAFFFEAKYADALKDSQAFLAKFAGLPMATDILFWLGDYYAATGEPLKCEEYFLQLVTSHPKSPDAPTALYEAAKSAFHRGDLVRASLLVQQLARDYADAPEQVRAQAELLHGDILAEQGRFEAAIPHFEAVRKLIHGTALAGAALGRLGEMYYSLGADNPAYYAKAADAFRELKESPTATPDQVEMAKYRLGKTYEKDGKPGAAITEYLDVVYQYRIDLREHRVRDWYYFARSGYDAARLLVLEKRFREAARLYERLAGAGIPTAADARERAREIRKAHNLED